MVSVRFNAALAAFLLASLTLAGCATPYTTPSTPAPAQWQGYAGFTSRMDTLEVREGLVRQGDVLAEVVIDHTLTGRLSEPVTLSPGERVERVIPAGTPAFAQQYTLHLVRRAYGAPLSINRVGRENPIEWCFALDGETLCAFWIGPGQALWIDDEGGPALLPNISDPSGIPGPAPIIDEEQLRFDCPLRVQAYLRRLDSRRVAVGTRIVDCREQDVRSIMPGRAVEWRGAETEIPVWRGTMVLSRPERAGRGVAVQARVVNRPTPPSVFGGGGGEHLRALTERLAASRGIPEGAEFGYREQAAPHARARSVEPSAERQVATPAPSAVRRHVVSPRPQSTRVMHSSDRARVSSERFTAAPRPSAAPAPPAPRATSRRPYSRADTQAATAPRPLAHGGACRLSVEVDYHGQIIVDGYAATLSALAREADAIGVRCRGVVLVPFSSDAGAPSSMVRAAQATLRERLPGHQLERASARY